MNNKELTTAQIIAFARAACEHDVPLVWYTERQQVAIFHNPLESDKEHQHFVDYEEIATLLARHTTSDRYDLALVDILSSIDDSACSQCFEVNFEDPPHTPVWDECNNWCRDCAADYIDYQCERDDPYAYRGLSRFDF